MAFNGPGRFGSGGYGSERGSDNINPDESAMPFASRAPRQSAQGSIAGMENFQFRPSLVKPSEGLVPVQVADSKLRKALDPSVKIPKEKKSRPSSPFSALLPFRKKSKEAVVQPDEMPSAFASTAEGSASFSAGSMGLIPPSFSAPPQAGLERPFYGANMRAPLENEYGSSPFYSGGADSISSPGNERKKSKKHRHKHSKRSGDTPELGGGVGFGGGSPQMMTDPRMNSMDMMRGGDRYGYGKMPPGFGGDRGMDGDGDVGGRRPFWPAPDASAAMENNNSSTRWGGGGGFNEERTMSPHQIPRDRWPPYINQIHSSPREQQHDMRQSGGSRYDGAYGGSPYMDDEQPRVDAASAFSRSFGGPPDGPYAGNTYQDYGDYGRSVSTGEPSQVSTRAGDDGPQRMDGRQNDLSAAQGAGEVRSILNTPRGRGTAGAKGGVPSGNRRVMSTPPRVRSYVPSQDTTPRTAENIAAAAASGLGGGRPWSVVVPPAGSPSSNVRQENDNSRSNSTPRHHHQQQQQQQQQQHWRTDTNESVNLLESTNNEFNRSRTPRSSSAPPTGQENMSPRRNVRDGARTPQRFTSGGAASASQDPSSPGGLPQRGESIFTIPTDAPSAERLLYKMLHQAPVQRDAPTPRRPPAAPPGKRSAQTVRFSSSLNDAAASPYSRRTRSPMGRTASAPALGDGALNTSAVSSDSPSSLSQPIVQQVPRNYQQLVVTVLRDKDREILSLRCSLALAYRYCAYAIHRRSGRMAPSSPNSLSMMESRFLAAAANSIIDTETDNPLLLVDRAPPHIQGLPSVPLPLGITYSIGQVSGILSMLNVDDMFQKKKPTRIFLRSWKPRFVVADDRGIIVFRNEEDFKQHAYQRALVVAPYYDLEYFVPSFRQMASIEGDDLLDFTDDFRKKRTSTSQDGDSRRADKSKEERRSKSKKGVKGLFSRHRSASQNASDSDDRESVDTDESATQVDARDREKSKKKKTKKKKKTAEGSDDEGSSDEDADVSGGTRLRRSRSAADYDIEHDLEKRSKRRRAQDYWRATKDLHAELMARIALQYASDSQFTYFGFIAKQPSSTLDDRKPSNPPLIFRTDSWQQHTEWVHFLAQCFNRKLYRQMFPNALTERRIGAEDKEVQTDFVGGWQDQPGDGGHEEEGAADEENVTDVGASEDADGDAGFVVDANNEYGAQQNEKGVQTELTAMWDIKTGTGDAGLSLLSPVQKDPRVDQAGVTPNRKGDAEREEDAEEEEEEGHSPPPPPPPPAMVVPKSGALKGEESSDATTSAAEAQGFSSEKGALVGGSATTAADGGISDKAWSDVVRELREMLVMKNEEIEGLRESLSRWQSQSTLLDRHVHELQDEKRAALERLEQMQEVMEMREEEVHRLRGTLDATNEKETSLLSDRQSGAEHESQQVAGKADNDEECAKRKRMEEELHVLRGAVNELARENQILEAELRAVRDGYADGLKSLARQALTDIDTLHGAYTTKRYADAILETHRRRGYHEEHKGSMGDAHGGSSSHTSAQRYGNAIDAARSQTVDASEGGVRDGADGANSGRAEGSGQRTPKMLPPPMSLHPNSLFTATSASPIRSPSSKPLLHSAGYREAQRAPSAPHDNIPVRIPVDADTSATASHFDDKSFAMLLLSYAASEIIDGCLTVDEEEARLLSSGPLRTESGRQWEILHHDTAALFRVSVSLISGADGSDGDAGEERSTSKETRQQQHRDHTDAISTHSHHHRRVTLPSRSPQSSEQTRGPPAAAQVSESLGGLPDLTDAVGGESVRGKEGGAPRRRSFRAEAAAGTPQMLHRSGGTRSSSRVTSSFLQDTFCGHEKRRSPAALKNPSVNAFAGSKSGTDAVTRQSTEGRSQQRSTGEVISAGEMPLENVVIPRRRDSVQHSAHSTFSPSFHTHQKEQEKEKTRNSPPLVKSVSSGARTSHHHTTLSTSNHNTPPKRLDTETQFAAAPAPLNNLTTRASSATMRRNQL